MPVLDAIVIGAGIHGLCAAYHLKRLGCARVAIMEQFEIEHSRGSSHGRSRITRSSYGNPVYVNLMKVAHGEEWPRLEKDCNSKLIYHCDGCYFGPGARFEEYVKTVAEHCSGVEEMSVADAKKRFPMFAFRDARSVLHDRTGGVIAASKTIRELRRICSEWGIEIFENTTVAKFVYSENDIAVQTNRGTFLSNYLVITAGPWSAQLLQLPKQPLVPIRQDVGYFELADRGAGAFGRFPVWAYIGDDVNDFYYGLPEFETPGIKAARHVTDDNCTDMKSHERNRNDPNITTFPDVQAILQIQQFLARQLTIPIVKSVGAETCFYTCTPTEDYKIGTHPDCTRISIGAGFSGHGFKLAPVTGRILAELCLRGASSVDEFTSHSEVFSWGTG
ncbi:MAG: FAD-dependent oxidoreductase [Planctomycetota bacterium]